MLSHLVGSKVKPSQRVVSYLNLSWEVALNVEISLGYLRGGFKSKTFPARWFHNEDPLWVVSNIKPSWDGDGFKSETPLKGHFKCEAYPRDSFKSETLPVGGFRNETILGWQMVSKVKPLVESGFKSETLPMAWFQK